MEGARVAASAWWGVTDPRPVDLGYERTVDPHVVQLAKHTPAHTRGVSYKGSITALSHVVAGASAHTVGRGHTVGVTPLLLHHT